MSIACTGVETLFIDGVDIQDFCAIISAEGLLSSGPQRGDIIRMDWTDGAIWQRGPNDTYSFDVPVIMRSSQQDVAIDQLRELQAYVGSQVTLIRRLNIAGTLTDETCQAVMASAVRVLWDFRRRKQIRAVMVFQNLTGGWLPV